MKRSPILQIFFISFLISACVQAQQPDTPRDHPTNENLIREPLYVRFQRPYGSPHFFVPLRFSSQNKNLDLLLTTKTSAVWINSYYYNDMMIDSRFTCSKSISCQSEEPLKFSMKNNGDVTGQGMLVKEQVNLGGVTLQNIGIFMATRFSKEGYGFLKDIGMLGLGVYRANPKAPTIQEYFQEPIVTMSFENHHGGRLIYGGYPLDTTRNNFGFVKVHNDDKSIRDGGFSVPLRAIGYRASPLAREKAIINFETPYIALPKSILQIIHNLVDNQGLSIPYPGHQGANSFKGRPVHCRARDVLFDLIVEFEEFDVRIPPFSYIIQTTEYPFLNEYQVIPKAESCFLTLVSEGFFDGNIVLGEPLFKAHDVVFDSENSAIGFSNPYGMNPSKSPDIKDPNTTTSSNKTDPLLTKSLNITDSNTSQNITHLRKNLDMRIVIGVTGSVLLALFFYLAQKLRKRSGEERKLVQSGQTSINQDDDIQYDEDEEIGDDE